MVIITNSVAMESPLGPALTNAFLCHHERKWLRECPVTYALIFSSYYYHTLSVDI